MAYFVEQPVAEETEVPAEYEGSARFSYLCRPRHPSTSTHQVVMDAGKQSVTTLSSAREYQYDQPRHEQFGPCMYGPYHHRGGPNIMLSRAQPAIGRDVRYFQLVTRAGLAPRGPTITSANSDEVSTWVGNVGGVAPSADCSDTPAIFLLVFHGDASTGFRQCLDLKSQLVFGRFQYRLIATRVGRFQYRLIATRVGFNAHFGRPVACVGVCPVDRAVVHTELECAVQRV